MTKKSSKILRLRRGFVFRMGLLIGSSAALHAEVAQVAEISEGGSSAEPVVSSQEVNTADLEKEVVVEKDGKRLVYQRLGEDVEMKSSNPLGESAKAPDVELSKEASPVSDFIVHAKSFGEGVTLVEIWEGAEVVRAWSNIDFNIMGGFDTFEKDGERFRFQLFASSHSKEDLATFAESQPSSISLPPPVFEGGDPGYQIPLPTSEDSQASKFILGLHEVYAYREDDLRAASVKREEALQKLRQRRLERLAKRELKIQYKVTKKPVAAPEE